MVVTEEMQRKMQSEQQFSKSLMLELLRFIMPLYTCDAFDQYQPAALQVYL